MSDPTPQTAAPAKPAPKPTPAPKPPEPTAIDWSKPVPIKLLRLDRNMQFPGKAQDDHVKATTAEERRIRPMAPTWDVEYLAPVRVFRVTFTDRARQRHDVGYIPECRVTCWEPA